MRVTIGVDYGIRTTQSPAGQPPPPPAARERRDRSRPGRDLVRSRLRDLTRPERRLWTPRQLLDLSSTVVAELAVPLGEITRFVPEQRWWERLGLTDGVEVWLLSWLPGQGTRPHDHSGACGAFTVLIGELTEDYRYPGSPSLTALRKAGESVGFSPNRAHLVRNLAARSAVSVHAYSPPLQGVREYDSLADSLAHVTRRVPHPARRRSPARSAR
jgi:quercetin dioxygenase-like cupin family protein